MWADVEWNVHHRMGTGSTSADQVSSSALWLALGAELNDLILKLFRFLGSLSEFPDLPVALKVYGFFSFGVQLLAKLLFGICFKPSKHRSPLNNG